MPFVMSDSKSASCISHSPSLMRNGGSSFGAEFQSGLGMSVTSCLSFVDSDVDEDESVRRGDGIQPRRGRSG